jgi:hypothetical protein
MAGLVIEPGHASYTQGDFLNQIEEPDIAPE